MKGYIVKGIGGFYYVKTEEGVIECKPRGIFRKQKITPVAGDEVTLETENGAAVIAEIAPRKNVFVRPPVANLDVLFLVASTTQPTPSTLVLDKLSAIAVDKGVQPVVVCTKSDLAEADFLANAYAKSTLPFIRIDYESGAGLDEVKQWINGRLCAFCGNSGVGKSTLLNALLNEERAIVSDIHGTTRDVIEDTVNLGGITFRFIDTAGIRETNDTIENLGIERTFQKLEQAEIVLWIVDATNAVSRIPQLTAQILPRCEGKRLILVFNKTDLVQDASTIPNSSFTVAATNVQCISISAKGRTNLDKLQQMLISAANLPTVTQNDVIVTNIRHYEALTHALEAIHRVQQGLAENLSGDFVSQDIRECIFHLSDIAGEVTNDMVLGNIFEHFCIGK